MQQWIDRLRAFGQIPISDAARTRIAVLLVVAFVPVAALIITVGSRIPQPATTPTPAPAAEAPPVPPAVTVAPEPAAARPPRVPARVLRAARATAQRFLTGYLPFTYGHGSAHRIPSATSELRDALAANRPRVPAAIARRRARVRHLEAESSTTLEATVVALITDGASTYSIGVTVQHTPRGWRVTGLHGG